jgi:hypothetical protein
VDKFNYRYSIQRDGITVFNSIRVGLHVLLDFDFSEIRQRVCMEQAPPGGKAIGAGNESISVAAAMPLSERFQ